jgi:hypothetical protein
LFGARRDIEAFSLTLGHHFGSALVAGQPPLQGPAQPRRAHGRDRDDQQGERAAGRDEMRRDRSGLTGNPLPPYQRMIHRGCDAELTSLGSATMPALIAGLADLKRKRQASAALWDAADAAVPVLLEGVASRCRETRENAARALREIEATAKIPQEPLLTALRDPSPMVAHARSYGVAGGLTE